MSAALSRAIMRLAVHCLGHRRRDWALAMQGEFAAAADDGRALSFALGCLAAAWRDMPAHREGRFALVSNGLALGLIVPAAALCVLGALLGFPFLAFGDVGVGGILAGASRQLPLLNDGDWGMAPPLTLLVLFMAAGQLLLAWFVLERNWSGVVAAHCFNAAVIATLVILHALLAFGMTAMMPLVAALVTEVLAVQALACWHDTVPSGAAEPGS